ncbi:hypothetical protein Tco_0583504 [Tanacetum coccineum]
MRGFLWCQGKLGGGKAKVAWNVVCLPMDEGGLGIRRLNDFNKALMITKSFWDIPYRGNMTWGWRNVLKLRPLIWEFIWKKLGNCLTTSVWFDRWCIQSPLADLISSKDIFREGFNKETKVCDLVINGVLDWPTSWLTHTVWNTIRAHGTKVSWYDAVWFSCCIPKHTVHLWLVIHRRLKTQDTLRHWDNMIYVLVTCSLCENQPDSHDHIFFECPFFSTAFGNQVQELWSCKFYTRLFYDILMDFIPFAARKTSKSVIAKLVVAATSYFIWQERNGRLFKNMKRTVNQWFFPIGVIGYVIGLVIRCLSIRLGEKFKLMLEVNVTCHANEALDMIRPVSNKEVKEAMFLMGNDKSIGLDGYTASFFKSAWDIVGSDVTRAVSYGAFSLVNDYRPISCCNVLFKCISKIIANRIKECLKRLVSPNQSAFVPGRSITDNILLTQEIMHNYHLDRGVPRCAFKVDIQKAYDTVDWEFLKVVLIGFGFHNRMVSWIMECVSTTSFSICINGSLHGYFKGKRGIRQGDPLSPYLFTLIMEVLTLMLHRRIRESNNFTYHRFCSKLELINLCFADDLFLFAHGDVSSAMVIKEALDEFKDASGLTPSMPKCTAYFCNVLNHTKLAILHILPFEEGRLPVKYLGVPLVSSRLIFRDCKELVEKVQNRVNDWKNKSLSIAGRLQLIQSVMGLCKGKAKVSWEDVCLPKQECGLGIRRLEHFNKALMVSHIWKLLSLKESLWVQWIHSGCIDSPYMFHTRLVDIFRAGWNLSTKVRDLIHDGMWNWPIEWFHIYPLLCTIHVPAIRHDKSAYLEWRDSDGIGKPFSVYHVWNSIRPRDNEVPWFNFVWFSNCIPRHAFNMWLIIKKRLKTQDMLSHWDVAAGLPLVCPLCEAQPDSHDHLFFECSFSSQIWMHMKRFAGLLNSGSSLVSIMSHLLPIAKRKSSKSTIGKLVVAAVAYFIWQERNRRLFKKSKRSAKEVIGCIMASVRLKLLSCHFKKSRDGVMFAHLWELPSTCFK